MSNASSMPVSLSPLLLSARAVMRDTLFWLEWVKAAVAGKAAALSGSDDAADLSDMLWLFRQVKPYTWVGVPRLTTLYRTAMRLNRVPPVAGDIVECGVFNGGSAAVLAHAGLRASSPRRVWLFDSFAGLPEPTDKDDEAAKRWTGECKGDPRRVTEIFNSLRLPLEDVHFVKGWFENTVPVTAPQIDAIACLHIDADWYESTKVCLTHLYPKVVPGGFVVIDDYGFWQGTVTAVDEFLAAQPTPPTIHRVGRMGCWFQKPGGQHS